MLLPCSIPRAFRKSAYARAPVEKPIGLIKILHTFLLVQSTSCLHRRTYPAARRETHDCAFAILDSTRLHLAGPRSGSLDASWQKDLAESPGIHRMRRGSLLLSREDEFARPKLMLALPVVFA